MRIDADFNVSLSGLEAELSKALKPLENLLRQATGNKSATVQFSGAGTEFFGQSLSALNDKFKLNLSSSEIDAYKKLFEQASAAKEALGNAIREGKSADAVKYMAEMGQAVQSLFQQLAKLTENIQVTQKDFTTSARNLQNLVNSVMKSRSVVKSFVGKTATDIFKELTDLENVLKSIDEKQASKELGRSVDFKKAIERISSYKVSSIDLFADKPSVSFQSFKTFISSLEQTFKDLEELEKSLNRRVQEDTDALRTVLSQLQGLNTENLEKIAANAARSRGFKNAIGTGYANSEARLQARAFSLLYGREPKSPEDDELFQQFVRTLGPTVKEFQNQLYNIFSNTLGSLGAAAIFLTANAIVKTSNDLAGLTKNLQIYQNFLESRNEQEKAQEIANLRKEMIALAGASEETVTKLSQALVEVSRLGGNTEGFADLMVQARIAQQQYGVDVNDLLKQSQNILIEHRRSFVDPGMLAEIVALGAPVADKALENFDKLLNTQAGLTLSYEQLRDAAIAYAKSGHEVEDSLAQVLEYAEKGAELYPKLAKEAEEAGRRISKSFLFVQGQEVFKAQQQVGTAITETLLSTFDNTGLGKGSKAILTMQTAILGLLTAIEQLMKWAGQFLDWLNSIQVAGVRAGDLLRIVAAIVAMSTALRAVIFIGKLVGGQLMDTVEAWKKLGEASRTKKVLVDTLEQAVKNVSLLRGGLKALGPILTALFGLFRSVFSPIGLAVTAVTALGAWAFQVNQARKAEAAALDARTGRSLVIDDQGTSRFQRVGDSLTYAFGDRRLDVTKALATLRNIDLAAAQIGISNSDIEGAQDLRDLYEIVKRYKETRNNFLRKQSDDVNIIQQRLLETQKALASVEQELSKNFQAQQIANMQDQLKDSRNDFAAGLLAQIQMGNKNRDLLNKRTQLQNQKAQLERELQKLQAQSQRFQTEADQVMSTLIEAFKPIEPILETIKNYDDALKTLQLYQEYALKRVRAINDYRVLDRFEQQEKEADALVKALNQVLTKEKNPIRIQVFREAIADAIDKALDARVSRLKETYALLTDDINALPTGYTRLNASIDNIAKHLRQLKAEYEWGRSQGVTKEKLRNLKNEIQRVENDLIQANNALSAYRAQLEKTRDQVVHGLEIAIRPASEFISDTSSFVYQLITRTQDVLKQYQNATADEFGTVVPSLLRRFDELFSVALNADIDRNLVDDYIKRAKAKKDEYQRAEALIKTFSANVGNLKDKTGIGLSYLVDKTSEIFFGDAGIVRNLETILDQAQSAFDAFEAGIAPSKRIDAADKLKVGLEKITQLNDLIALFQQELPDIREKFVDGYKKQLQSLQTDIEIAKEQVERYQKELNELKSEGRPIETTQKLLEQARKRLAELTKKKQEYEKAIEQAANTSTQFVTQTINELNKQVSILVDKQFELLERFKKYLESQVSSYKLSLSDALDPLRKYQGKDELTFEKVDEEINRLKSNIFESISHDIQEYNETAFEAIREIDKIMKGFSKEYRETLFKLNQSKNTQEQNRLRNQLIEMARKTLDQLKAKNPDELELSERTLLLMLEAQLFLLDQYKEKRDYAKQTLQKLEPTAEKERLAGYALVFKQQIDKKAREIQDTIETPIPISGSFQQDYELLQSQLTQINNQMQELGNIIEQLAASEASIYNPQVLSDAINLYNKLDSKAKELFNKFFEERWNKYIRLLIEGAEIQNSQLFSVEEKIRAKEKAFKALEELSLLRQNLPSDLLDKFDKDFREAVYKSAELFRGLLDFNAFTSDNYKEVFGNLVQKLLGLNKDISKTVAEAIVRSLYTPEIEKYINQVIDQLDSALSDASSSNDLETIAVLTQAASDAIFNAEGLLDEKLLSGYKRRLQALQQRTYKLQDEIKLRNINNTISELNKQAELAEKDDQLIEVLRIRISTIEFINKKLEELSPEQQVQLVDVLREQQERIKTLFASSQFLMQVLGQNIIKLWNSISGQPQQKAEEIAKQILQSIPELRRLPQDLQDSLIKLAVKPILRSVVDATQKAAELVMKDFSFTKSQLNTDIVSYIQKLSEMMTKFREVALAQVQAAKFAFDIASEQDKDQARVNLKSAVLSYIESYRAFVEEITRTAEEAYKGGKLTDAQYAEAIKTLESLTVNPVLLINQLKPFADAIGITADELERLVKGMLDLSGRLKQMRQELDQTKFNILSDTSLTKEQREYLLRATEVQNLLKSDVPNSSDNENIATSLRSLVFEYLETTMRAFERTLPSNISGEQRDIQIANARNELIRTLLSLRDEDLFSQLHLDVSGEQAKQFANVIRSALQDARSEINKATEALNTILKQLISQLENLLQSFFMEIMNIPTRMMEEAKARSERSAQLQSDLSIIQKQIEEYERLYQAAVQNYGAASEQAEKYRQKLAELRIEQKKLSDEFAENEQRARDFFDYLLEAISNFLKAFANALQQMIAQQLAIRTFQWASSLFGGSSTSDTGTLGGGGSVPVPSVVNPESLGQAAVSVGSGMATQALGGAISSGLTSLGVGAGIASFAGSLLAGIGVGIIANTISNLISEYSDLEQDHRRAGINRFAEMNFGVSVPSRKVEVHIHGQYDRQKLASETKQIVFEELGKELLD